MEKINTSYKLAKGTAMWMDYDAEGRKVYAVGDQIRQPSSCNCYSQKAAIKQDKMYAEMAKEIEG